MTQPFIKLESVTEEEQDELLMSYLNSDYMTSSWTSPKNNNEPSYEQTTLLWEMNQGLLYPTPYPDTLSSMTLNPLMDIFLSQPTSPRSYCSLSSSSSSSSSSDSEQPKKRRGRKKREQTSPPMIAPAPLKPLAALLPAQPDKELAKIEKPTEEAASITKRQERLIKNRAAALLSRKRKREHLTSLEDKCHHLTATNQTMEKRILELERENKELKKRLESVTTVTTTTSSHSDHFLVMIICYLVFIVLFSRITTTYHQTKKWTSSSDVVSSFSFLEEENSSENTFRKQARKRKQFQRIIFPTL